LLSAGGPSSRPTGRPARRSGPGRRWRHRAWSRRPRRGALPRLPGTPAGVLAPAAGGPPPAAPSPPGRGRIARRTRPGRTRLAEETDLGREGGLVARLPPQSLERVEEGGLLTADVGAGAAAHFDFAAESLSHHVLAQEPSGAGLTDGLREPLRRQRVLAADVD